LIDKPRRQTKEKKAARQSLKTKLRITKQVGHMCDKKLTSKPEKSKPQKHRHGEGQRLRAELSTRAISTDTNKDEETYQPRQAAPN
jgi:hypothetical protein